MRGRTRALAILAVAVAALATAAPAPADTANLGQIAPIGSSGDCPSACTVLQYAIEPATPSYTVPPGGPWTVTSWSARGGPTAPDQARLQILRATSVPEQFALVAQSADGPIGIDEAAVHPAAIPVQPGDVLAVRTLGGAGDMAAIHTTPFTNDYAAFVTGNLDTIGQTIGPGGLFYGASPNYRANVSATLTTSPDPLPTEPAKKKKCKKKKKKKGKAAAGSAKKKKKKKCAKPKKKKKR